MRMQAALKFMAYGMRYAINGYTQLDTSDVLAFQMWRMLNVRLVNGSQLTMTLMRRHVRSVWLQGLHKDVDAYASKPKYIDFEV